MEDIIKYNRKKIIIINKLEIVNYVSKTIYHEFE